MCVDSQRKGLIRYFRLTTLVTNGGEMIFPIRQRAGNNKMPVSLASTVNGAYFLTIGVNMDDCACAVLPSRVELLSFVNWLLLQRAGGGGIIDSGGGDSWCIGRGARWAHQLPMGRYCQHRDRGLMSCSPLICSCQISRWGAKSLSALPSPTTLPWKDL